MGRTRGRFWAWAWAHIAAVVALVCAGCPHHKSGNPLFVNGGTTVATVAPRSGPPAGGSIVTIVGTGFVPGASVSFGGVSGTNVVVQSATQLTVTTPPGKTGAVDVTVASGGGLGVLKNGFTYVVLAAGGPRQSSAVALSGDDTQLVNVNPDANSVTIFDVTTDAPQKVAEITVGRDPRSVALQPDGSKAYVCNARDNSVSVVTLGTRNVTNTIAVGAEPVACALSPNGTRLYVANGLAGTLTAIDTATESVIAVTTVTSAGNHPRAIAITNNGDAVDTDETVHVAMFYAATRPNHGALDEAQDDQKEGRVAVIPMGGPKANTIVATVALGPLAASGFGSNGSVIPFVATLNGGGGTAAPSPTNPQVFNFQTGCFPNLLAGIAIHPVTKAAYVVSTGASPNGPFRFNANAEGLVSVFDTTSNTEIVAAQTNLLVREQAPLNMNQGVEGDTGLLPLLVNTNPVAVAWRPDGSDAWVVIQCADTVVRLTANATGVPTINSPLTPTPLGSPPQIVRVDLHGGSIPGKAPRGIAINRRGDRAYVSNYITRSITTLDISKPMNPTIAGAARSSAVPAAGTPEATQLLGGELFYSARDRMSLNGWTSCIVCHPDGLSDNVTWMFDSGPRQTPPLDGTFTKTNPASQRILGWNAVRIDVQSFESNTRNLFGGQGLIDDDRLFLAFGGSSGSNPNDSALVEQYHEFFETIGNVNDLTAQALPSMPTARRDHAIATAPDGKVYIVGGRAGAGAGSLVTGGDSVLEFNPRTNAFRQLNNAGFTPRYAAGASAVRTSGGTKIYVAGGYAAIGGAAVATVEEYDPASNAWRTVASLPRAVAEFGVVTAGGISVGEPLQLIHVICGNTATEAAPAVTNAVQRFQPDPSGVGFWTTLALSKPLTARRALGAGMLLRNNSRIFVIGGFDASGKALATVEEYQAQTGTTTTTPLSQLPQPRAAFGIGSGVRSAVGNGNIYVMGGVDDAGNESTNVFAFRPAQNGPTPGAPGTPSGVWDARGDLSVARRGLRVSSPPGLFTLETVKSSGRDARADAITAWISSAVRPFRAPVPLNDPTTVRGRQLFGTKGLTGNPSFSCATCHGGPLWTRSLVDFNGPPSPELGLGLGNEQVSDFTAELLRTASQTGGIGATTTLSVLVQVGTFNRSANNEVKFLGPDQSQRIEALGADGFNIPSLLSVGGTAPYFHNGLAPDLNAVLNGSVDNNGGALNRIHFVSNTSDRVDLVQFLRSIDETTPTFP